MKRLLSILIAFAMLISFLPATTVFAEEPVQYAGIKIEYPTATAASGQPAGIFSGGTPDSEIKYSKSSGRVEFLPGTVTSASWRRGSLGFVAGAVGQYGAYKIRVPKAGKYDITVQYREDAGAIGGIYILPVSKMDSIATEITSRDPIITVNFNGSTYSSTAAQFAESDAFEWVAPEAGEYIVVWKAVNIDAGKRMNPANLIFDGKGDGKAPLNAVSEIAKVTLNLAQSESTTITTKSVTMNDLSAGSVNDIAALTYESSDTNIVSVSGNVITATGEGTAKIYTKNGKFILAENEIKVSNIEYSGVYAAYPTFVEGTVENGIDNLGYASGTFGTPADIDYNTTGGRIEWYDYTGTRGGTTAPAWNSSVACLYLNKGEYGAYKINIPKKGFYDVTLTYFARSGGGIADIYLLPGSTKKEDIPVAIANADPFIESLSFLNTDAGIPGNRESVADKTYREIKSVFNATIPGEYIVVWACTSENGGTVRPANLLFDGGDKRAVTRVGFKVSATLNPSVTLYLSDGSTVDGSKATITYESSDETLLKINNETGKFTGLGAGNVTVTANIVYNGDTYTAEIVKTLTGDESLPYSDVARKYMFNKKSADWQQTIIDPGETVPRNADVRGITYEYTENNYAWYGTTENKYSAAYCYAHEEIPDGRMRIYRVAGGWTGFRIMVPARGKYAINIEYIKLNTGEGVSDVYIIPASVPVENAGEYLNEDYCVGEVNTLDPLAVEMTLADKWIGEVNIPAAGEYAVIFKARTKSYTTIRSLTLDGVDGMKRTELTAENDGVDVGKSIQASVRAFFLDGSEIPSDDISVEYKSEHPHIASVSETGLITGMYEGDANITATVKYGTAISKSSFTVTVTDNSGVDYFELDTFADDLYKGAKTKVSVLAHMNSGNVLSVKLNAVEFVYGGDEGVLTVEDGLLCANNIGTGTIKANVTFKGEKKETNELSFEIKQGTQKNRTTIYTDEMRADAFYNAKNYDWAKSLAKTAMNKADAYLENFDDLYDMIEPDNLPRSQTLGLVDDPNAYDCIYCGMDLQDKYASTGWGVNPKTRPWKIQCPDCKRLFPSNDFESFYELGKDEYGVFDLSRARQLHHEMLYHKNEEECTCNVPTEENTPEWYEFYGYGVEGGYLYNELYPEFRNESSAMYNKDPYRKDADGNPLSINGARWAVDDGWGYDTGYKAASGIPIKKAFVAFYNFDIWSTGGPLMYIPKAIEVIRDAYLYTREEKYGIAGAILTDRIADVYPTYDFTKYIEYQNFHGGRNNGKIDGNIKEPHHLELYSRAYDAFWPIMGHPKVIEYLSAKAVAFGLENEKLSAEMIRKNCEDGICREGFKAAKEAKILSNFGSHQKAVSAAAIALDSYPETEEMIEWLCAPEEITKISTYKYGKKFTVHVGNSGGGLLAGFLNDVDRDGFGAEVGANYNQGWLKSIQAIAELYYNYDKDSILNFYNNPKFSKMFYAIYKMTMAGGYTLQVGDEHSTASTGNRTDKATTLMGYIRLGDPKLALQYYALTKNDANTAAYKDIFEKRTATIEEEIEAIVAEFGEIELSSENLTGYGLAVLRSGEKIKGSNEKNLKRDTWLGYGNSAASHGHDDVLQLGIDAYGFNFTPDLGYPAATSYDPNRLQWVQTTLSHNTVVVDETRQTEIVVGTPLHFDDAGKVKIVDVEAPGVYEQTDIYRRTIVSVQASNEVDYTVDFFRVRGGNEHIYSFHTQSYNGVTTDGLNLVAQNGGTYAGENTEYGNDPNTQNSYYYETYYPRGYTWLRNVRRDNDPMNAQFSVNFKQTDFNKQVSDSKGLNLKWTALNDWTPSSVGIATAEPPRHNNNKNIPELDYMLVHRKSDETLDTLFTSVIQPYNGSEYIESMESVALAITGGEENGDDTAKAVKVKLKTGRTDYVIYATNNGVTYTLTDGNVSFNFRGFVGVYSVNESGANIYSYVNDGDIIGDVSTTASVSGKVIDFEKDLAFENYITVEMDRTIDAETLAGRYIYVDNVGELNGAYKIEGAEITGNKAILNIGDVTLIEEYRDSGNLELGYIYNISEGDKFVIPLSATEDIAPVLDDVSNDLTTSAGSSISVKLQATSSTQENVSYIGTHLPRGASIDSASGVVTWKPTASQVGVHTFVITARDTSGRENTTSFDITVYGSTTGSSSSNKEETPSTEPSGTPAGGGGGGGGATPAPSKPETNVGDDVSQTPATTEKFVDLGNHEWAKDAINTLADAGIIKGTSANTFSPAANITRADFTILLVRAFELTSDNTENFADVTDGDYFVSELAVARNTGVVGGIGENKFAPGNSITRQDMMVIVYRAMQKLGVELEIADVDYEDFAYVAEYATDAVKALITSRLVNGKNGNIAPLDYTTRAEVAVLIKRILDYVK